MNRLRIAVVGAHLTGQPLNHQLTDRDAVLIETTTTAAVYRMSALDTDPPKPGLVRVDPAEGSAFEVEVWEMAAEQFGTLVAGVPSPLCIGQVLLSDGTTVSGFLCEPFALDGAVDISGFGGWRAYLEGSVQG